MPREIYTLSDETEAVLSDFVKPISFELDKSDKYLYAILDESKTDYFSAFRKIYKAAIRAGAPFHIWDNALASDRAHYAPKVPQRSEKECLMEKMNSHNKTIGKLVESLADGILEAREIKEILSLIEIERTTLTLLEARLTFQLGLLETGEVPRCAYANGHARV